MEIRDPATGQIKSWVWIGGAGIVGLLFLLGSRGSNTGPSPVESAGQSSGITPQLNELTDLVKQLAAKQTQTPTSPTNPNNPSSPTNPNNPTNPNDDDDRPDRPNRPNRPRDNRPTPVLDWIRDLFGGNRSWVPRNNGSNPVVNPTNSQSETSPILNSGLANLIITGGGGDSQNGNLGMLTARDYANMDAYNRIITLPTEIDKAERRIARDGRLQQVVRDVIPDRILDRLKYSGGPVTIQPVPPIPSALPRADKTTKAKVLQRNQDNVTT